MQLPERPPAHDQWSAGQSLAEYALILSLILLVAVAALTFFGREINSILSLIAGQIQN